MRGEVPTPLFNLLDKGFHWADWPSPTKSPP